MNKSQRSDWILNSAQAILLTAFIACQNLLSVASDTRKELPVAIDANILRLYALGEPEILARVLLYYINSYDSQAGKLLAYKDLDYDNLINWLEVILEVDSQTQEPLLAASRVFVEVKDAERMRKIILFIRKKYQDNPDLRWRWMVDAILIAKHRLQDKSLALQMAKELRQLSTESTVPYWARDIEHLILAELGEWESASMVITSLLDSGMIKDSRELQFLTRQLQVLKENIDN